MGWVALGWVGSAVGGRRSEVGDWCHTLTPCPHSAPRFRHWPAQQAHAHKAAALAAAVNLAAAAVNAAAAVYGAVTLGKKVRPQWPSLGR